MADGIDACCGQDESALLVRLTKFTLHDLCEKGDAEGVRELLRKASENPDEDYDPGVGSTEQTIDVNARDNTGCTPLHTALLFGRLDVLRLLCGGGTGAGAEGPAGSASVSLAAPPFPTPPLKLGLKCQGSPALHVAVAMGSIPENRTFSLEAVKLLLRAGADPSSVDDAGRGALHLVAAAAGEGAAVELAEALRDAAAASAAGGAGTTTPGPSFAYAAVDSADRAGCTPLFAGCEHRNGLFVAWLLAHGANPAAADKTGDTAAHAAAKAGWADGLRTLLAKGPASLSAARNAAGFTPEECLVPVYGGDTGAGAGAGAAAGAASMDVDGGSGSTTGSAPAIASSPSPTLVITHEVCAHHHTCAPIRRDVDFFPPENTFRLDVLLNPTYGTLQAGDLRARTRVTYGAPPCKMSDVLRVHEYEYVRRVLAKVGEAAPAAGLADGTGIRLIDSDTSVSRLSWAAALRAAGSVCAAVDSLVAGEARTAFCPVRPPGHHAGPRGIVTCERDPEGSHGFCLLNNVAVGAAYALHHFGREPFGYAGEAAAAAKGASSSAAASASSSRPVLRRVAIFDFDVHHGNGTEAILRNLVPHEVSETIALPFARAAVSMMSYKPWLDGDDGNRVLFISSHGYGSKRDEDGKPIGTFYPGSGASTGWDVGSVERVLQEAGTAGSAGSAPLDPMSSPRAFHPSSSSSSADGAHHGGSSSSASGLHIAVPPARSLSSGAAAVAATPLASLASPRTAAASIAGGVISSQARPLPPPVPSLQPGSCPVPEPLLERDVAQPHVLNVAMNHGYGPKTWRRIMTADVLPRLAAFQPDLILISAGFDAHKTDTINSGYMRLAEDDYFWITRQLVKIANTTAGGRVLSVLEGGYKVQGRIVSPFGRSVAAHVRALSGGFADTWDTERERAQLVREIRWEAEVAAQAKAAAEAAAMAAAMTPGAPTSMRSPKMARLGGASASVAAAAAASSASTASKTAFLLGEGASAASSSVSAPTIQTSVPLLAPPASASSSSTSISTTSSLPNFATPLADGGGPEGEGDESGRRSKRRRAAVDYAALDAQVRAEEAAAAAAKAAAAAAAASATAGAAEGPK